MLFHIDCSIKVYQSFSLTCMQFITGRDSQCTEIILPITGMLALCLMLAGTYYAQNYASIIGWCLAISDTMWSISSSIYIIHI